MKHFCQKKKSIKFSTENETFLSKKSYNSLIFDNNLSSFYSIVGPAEKNSSHFGL